VYCRLSFFLFRDLPQNVLLQRSGQIVSITIVETLLYPNHLKQVYVLFFRLLILPVKLQRISEQRD
jgi:hypothetical protein